MARLCHPADHAKQDHELPFTFDRAQEHQRDNVDHRSDECQDANGLLYADRTPKIPLKEIARAVRESRLHIQGGV